MSDLACDVLRVVLSAAAPVAGAWFLATGPRSNVDTAIACVWVVFGSYATYQAGCMLFLGVRLRTLQREVKELGGDV